MDTLNPDELENLDMEVDESNLDVSDMESTYEPTLQLVASGTAEHNGIFADYAEFSIMNGNELQKQNCFTDPTQLVLNMAKNIHQSNKTTPAPKPSSTDPHEDKNSTDRGAGICKIQSTFKSVLAAVGKNGFWGSPVGKPNPPSNSSGSPDGADDPFKGVTLDSVGGLELQIQWLKQCILKHLKNKNENYSWGIKPPKGVLFYGPPGTGKTLLARAFGNELSKQLGKPVKFFHRKGGDVFSKWFGESSVNLRNLFEDAIKSKPSIIFFDELDGLCPSREGHNNEAYNSVVTTLLGLMDTLPPGDVFVIGATNRLVSIDAAMLRPGRFDKHLEFFPPNLEARKRIFEINTAKWKRSSKLSAMDLEKIGQRTVGFTGADIEKLCREAFFAAFDRHVPDSDLDVSIGGMEVVEADWNLALSKTKPTNTAIFGSTLFIPRLPNSVLEPLVRDIQKEILDKLLPILPKQSQGGLDLGDSSNGSATISSFLMWDESSLSVDVMESIILPGLLVHPEISEHPVYILSQENILNTLPGNRLSYISETINQALNSFKPCILYIPRLNDLVSDLKMNSYISRQLIQFRGKPVLVLATSSCPHTELPKQDNIRNIFGGCNSTFSIRKPNYKERLDFFRPMFDTLGKAGKEAKSLNLPAVTKLKLESQSEEAAKITTNDNIELILSLHDALLRKFVSFFDINDKGGIPKELNQILKNYALNKFLL